MVPNAFLEEITIFSRSGEEWDIKVSNGSSVHQVGIQLIQF